MGQMRLLTPQRERVSHWAVKRAYLAGVEGTPWPGRNTWNGGEIVIERPIRDSGNLYIPWSVERHGELILSTASLRESERPYNLPVELARGVLSRVCNQAAAWQMAGLTPSEAFESEFRKALGRFLCGAVSQSNPEKAAECAEQALLHGLDAIDILSRDYSQQALAIRRQQPPRLTTLLAGNVESAPLSGDMAEAFLNAFNAAAAPLPWREVEREAGRHGWDDFDRQIEWCREHGLKICAGPLLRLDQHSLPDWIYRSQDDFDRLESQALKYVDSAVQRYRGNVQIWHCAAGMNVPGALPLSEQQKLRLTMCAVEAVRRADPETPVIVSIDQPWGEYLIRDRGGFSPLHFADALVRSELGLAGIGLEINLGYWPGGTLPRDLLEFSRQIDRWSVLGLPLLVILTSPSRGGEDPLARRRAKPLAGFAPRGPAPLGRQPLLERLVPLLLSRQPVYGLIWNQLCDANPHEFAHGGLFDAQGLPKPILDSLTQIRREHLA